MSEFVTNIDGELKASASGVVRAVKTYPDRYDLIPLFMLKRWAELYGRGAVVHGDRNWEKACTQEDLDGFERSAFHHFIQRLTGEKPEEDHTAAIFFNLAGAEMVKAKLKG